MGDITAELAATCAALGFYDGIEYHLDTHCLDVIKDLIRFLKRDDDSHTVRRYLGQAKLLETDLKKIFVHHFDKSELWDVLLRLLINLTSPALMVYNEVLPSEKTNRNMYQQLVLYLQHYKVALADDRVWSVVGQRLKKILNMDSAERGEDNELIIERILTLIRNVLQVPPNDNEKRADNDATVHDEVLFALHTSGLVDMLLFIASNMSEQQYHLQVLEIIALMLREQCATKLATVGLERNARDKDKESAKLLAIREKQVREKMEKMKKYAGSRHSRFGGTYVVENMKAIGDNQLLCHKPYQKIEALQFGQEKVKIKKGKAKIPLADPVEVRTSALSVRLFLKEFCVEFMNGAYNPVMRFARSCINGGANGVAADASHYLWTLRFFMEFNRRYKFQIKYVSETISTEIFHLVQSELEKYYEMMMTDKKKIPHWSYKLHLALRAYQELLLSLSAMDTCSDPGVRESSKIIKSNVFYVPEYRETILSQLINYDPLKMSRTYLIDVLTTAHIFIKMLKQFCIQSRTVIVRKKAIKKSRSKKKKSSAKQTSQSTAPVASFEDMWDDIAPEISAVMKEGVIPQVVPFDATLDTPIDEQKSDAMKKIQKLLRKKEFENAVGLLRAAREVWPENDCFGKPDILVEEEFLALRDIFFAQLGEDLEQPEEPQHDDNGEIEEEENEEEDDETGEVAYEETNFKFDEFLRRFANVKVVKAMAILLRQFDENTAEVNHYIVKMLYRIAYDCKMPAMIFQASIFRIFQRILESQSSQHKDLKRFAVHIIGRFAQVAETNPKAYMELLFWKTTREANEMVDGYDTVQENGKVSRALWTEAEEDELRTLFMEHQTNKYTQDLIDWILENIISDDRTRRGVIKKLKEMCLVVNSKTVRSEVQKRLPTEWSEEEIAQLTEIWHRVREDDDPIDIIHGALTIKRPKKKIKDKLLEIGLAKDRKELRKKRSKNRDHVKSSWETQSVSGQSDDNTDDSENDDESSKKSRMPAVPKKKKSTVKSKKQPMIVYSDAQLSGLLKDVIDRNMREGLEWLKESLEEAMDDRDEESSEGIPLVPFTDHTSAAMDSPSFQRLLRAIGIEPPADEQEAYWRVPASMLVTTIRKRCNLIEDALAGKFLAQEEPAADRIDDSDPEEDPVTEDNSTIRDKKSFKSKSSRLEDSSDGSAAEATIEDDSDLRSNAKKSFKSKSVRLDDSSDGSDAESTTQINGDSRSTTKKSFKSKSARLDDSSDDSDAEATTKIDDDSRNTAKKSFKSKSARLDDSSDDSEAEATAKANDDSRSTAKKSFKTKSARLDDSSEGSDAEATVDLENDSKSNLAKSSKTETESSIPDEPPNKISPASDSDEDFGEASKRSRSQDSGSEMPSMKKRRIAIISDDED